MEITKLVMKTLALLTLTLTAAGGARAQIGIQTVSRTYVATYGDDSNPCSRTRPCRNFDAALAAVTAGGEVLALDDGLYAKTTISKSATIAAPPGVHAEIAPASGSAVTVNASDSKRVVIRNLYLSSRGATTGVLFGGSSSTLRVEGCVIAGFKEAGGAGIDFSGQGGQLSVTDTVVRDGRVGIKVSGAGGGPGVTATLDRVRVENHLDSGVHILNNVSAVARDTVSTNNEHGFRARYDLDVNGAVLLQLENCQATYNERGLYAQGAATLGVVGYAEIAAANTVIARNVTGLATFAHSNLISFGGNTLHGNQNGGEFADIRPKQ